MIAEEATSALGCDFRRVINGFLNQPTCGKSQVKMATKAAETLESFTPLYEIS
jgi:hypothetical protein